MLSFTPNQTIATDTTTKILTYAAGGLVLVGVGLLPILLLPLAGLTIATGKLFLLVCFLSLALIVYAVLLFRRGGAEWSLPLSLVALWSLPVIAILSSALSGAITQSLLGDSLGDGAATTLGVLALTTTVVMIFARETKMVRYLGITLLASLGALAVWHWIRILTNGDLSFGLLQATTDTPVGSWGDLMILLAVGVLCSLIVASQFTLSRIAAGALMALVTLSLGLMMLGASTYIWIGLGVISLVAIAFTSLQRQSLQTIAMVPTKERSPMLVLLCGGVIFLATVVVMLGGTTLQNTLVEQTGVNYVEVRPSLSASLDITAAVWQDNALLGTGPTSFATAWRVHKDPSINQSVFWNTDFRSGYSTLTTAAVEMGVIGLGAWIIFLLTFLVSGVRTFLRTAADTQSYPYRLALVAYVAAFIIWSAVIVSAPGWGVVLLGGAATGAYLGLTSVLRPRRVFTISLIQNQRAGFVFVLVLVVLVILSIALLSILSRQIMAAAQYGQAVQATTIESARDMLAQSFATNPTARAAQAEAVLRLQEMGELITLPEPSAAEQQQFQAATVAAVNAASVAVDLRPNSVEGWYTLFAIYNALARIGIEGALERAIEVQQTLLTLDPKSPEPVYLAAQLALLQEDVVAARAAITEAIRLKSNYTPALYLAAQIEIAAGNVPEAIAVTSAILSFEPQNAARWYQLGVLFASQELHAEGIQALNEAVALDADYANARYVRALSYAALGDIEAALADMRRVAELNPGLAIVESQITSLESGIPLNVDSVPLIEENADTEPSASDSDLVTGEVVATTQPAETTATSSELVEAE